MTQAVLTRGVSELLLLFGREFMSLVKLLGRVTRESRD